jgi:hypothetical protein
LERCALTFGSMPAISQAAKRLEHMLPRHRGQETGHGVFPPLPKDRYQTKVESWRNLQSANIEFTMKRLRDPIEADS